MPASVGPVSTGRGAQDLVREDLGRDEEGSGKEQDVAAWGSERPGTGDCILGVGPDMQEGDDLVPLAQNCSYFNSYGMN